LVVASSLREAALEAFRTHPELSTEPATHLGVGSAVRGDRAAVVALFVERLAELEPFPRQLPAPGLSRRLCGRLESGLKMAEVFVTRPAGDVARAATHLEGTRFCAPLDFTSNGLHEVEVVARGPNGPEVVALFHVEVGARRGRAKREHLEEPRTDEAARAQMVERVNALRRAHGASPLVADPALDAVAQAYSDRMAREGFFAHVAPDGSDLRKRLTQAGYAYRAAGENLGFAPGPMSAQRGIEQSPAHRGNLLGTSFTRLGIGLAYRERNGQRDLVLTQVLADPVVTSGRGTAAEAYAALAKAREALGLKPLVRSEVLEQIARDHARRALAADEPSDVLPGSTLHERAFAALPDVERVTVDLYVADAATSLPDSDNLKDARNTQVGIGFVRGDSPRYGPGRTWVVVIYASGG
ncbi:MAG: CAP domain-containing protein, partial [Myxococcaceae bacterium]|nr:CAP domain-containing protein [Myxococcaceae bacterium]